VKAHIFLSLLAYYVEWHMRRAWAELLYQEQDLEALRQIRDPVLLAQPSVAVMCKQAAHQTADGLPVHTWTGLLATLSRNTCKMKDDPASPSFVVQTDASALQQRAFDLLACARYEDSKN
jgi:hypothetical protein